MFPHHLPVTGCSPSFHWPHTPTPASSFLNSQVAVLRRYWSELECRIWDGMRTSRGECSRWKTGQQESGAHQGDGRERVQRAKTEGKGAFCCTFQAVGLEVRGECWQAFQNGPGTWQSATGSLVRWRLTRLRVEDGWACESLCRILLPGDC